MKTKLHQPSCEDYVACLQRGGSPFYAGSVMQRGYGIGGLFKGLAAAVLPLLPKVGKIAAQTALGVVGDKMAGVPISKSLKKRTTAAGKKMILDAISNKTPKRSPARKRNKTRRPSHTKRIRTTDAFGLV